MAETVGETGKGQDIVRAAALMVQTERIGAGKGSERSATNFERIRGAETRKLEPIAPGLIECTEICFHHGLIRRRIIRKAFVLPRAQFAFENCFTGLFIDQGKALVFDSKFAERSE